MDTLTIWVWPPLIVNAKKGNVGAVCPSDFIKCAKICACIWFTSIKGISNPIAKDFENETPTNSEPIKPGPLVKAMAFNCFLSIFAFCKASCTTGTIFC